MVSVNFKIYSQRMKKLFKFLLNPITLMGIGFSIFLIWLRWNKEAFPGFDFLNFLGPLAGGISLIIAVGFVIAIAAAIIVGLAWYGDWYQERFKK